MDEVRGEAKGSEGEGNREGKAKKEMKMVMLYTAGREKEISAQETN